MIVKCDNCPKFYDDQFRLTNCPHDTFSANDGWNNFHHYNNSWLADYEPRRDVNALGIKNAASEFEIYEIWLAANKVRTKEIP